MKIIKATTFIVTEISGRTFRPLLIFIYLSLLLSFAFLLRNLTSLLLGTEVMTKGYVAEQYNQEVNDCFNYRQFLHRLAYAV